MAANRTYKFLNLDELLTFLNGGLRGTDINRGVYGLNGLSLTFTSPVAVTMTFGPSTQSDPNQYQLKDLKAQLEGAISGLRVSSANGVLILGEVTPTSGVALSSSPEDAKRILGFDKGRASIGKVFAPPGTSPPVAPCWTWIDTTSDNQYFVMTWE